MEPGKHVFRQAGSNGAISPVKSQTPFSRAILISSGCFGFKYREGEASLARGEKRESVQKLDWNGWWVKKVPVHLSQTLSNQKTGNSCVGSKSILFSVPKRKYLSLNSTYIPAPTIIVFKSLFCSISPIILSSSTTWLRQKNGMPGRKLQVNYMLGRAVRGNRETLLSTRRIERVIGIPATTAAPRPVFSSGCAAGIQHESLLQNRGCIFRRGGRPYPCNVLYRAQWGSIIYWVAKAGILLA